jgi:hypothetical protein
MRRDSELSRSEVYRAARRSYDEEHQACPHCRRQHCVFRSVWGTRVEYACSLCDFCVCHDAATGRYYVSQGHSPIGELPLFDASAATLLPDQFNDPAVPDRILPS